MKIEIEYKEKFTYTLVTDVFIGAARFGRIRRNFRIKIS